ncbi:MAG: histidine kinase [Actinotalea sp.]|nr:histidine kinase [Actinotalea sp.]
MHAVPALAPKVAVRVLGPLEVRGGGAVLGPRDLGGGKPRQLLEILALNQGVTMSKTLLTELLWGERAPADALGTLESYVSVLRHKLLQVCTSRTAVIRTGVGGYVIERGSIDLDLETFSSLVRRAERADLLSAHRYLSEALQLVEVPLLPQEGGVAWAEQERAVHSRKLVRALVRSAEVAVELGRTEEALARAEQALVLEPHHERAWCAKLTAYERAGRQGDGLRAYGVCRASLAAELGCAPGAGLQAVFHRLLTAGAHLDEHLGDLIQALLLVHDAAGTARVDSLPGERHPLPGRAASDVAARRALEALVACARDLRPGQLALTAR